MKFYYQIKRITFRSTVLLNMFLLICIFFLSGQMNSFAGQESGSPEIYQGRTVRGIVTDNFKEL